MKIYDASDTKKYSYEVNVVKLCFSISHFRGELYGHGASISINFTSDDEKKISPADGN